MKIKAKKSLSAINWKIALLIILLWLICMYAITHVTAESLYVNYAQMGEDLMENAWANARFSSRLDGDEPKPPGYTEYVLWQALVHGVIGNNYGLLYDSNNYNMLISDKITYDSARAIFDSDENLIAYPSNFFTFSYFYNEPNINQGLLPDGYAVCILDKQIDSARAKHLIEQNFLYSRRYEALYYRFTGVLNEGYFTVQKAEFFRDPKYGNEESGWIKLPSFGDAVSEDANTVTLYTQYVDAQTYTPSRSFNYYNNNEKFNNLGEFIFTFNDKKAMYGYNQYDLMDFVHINERYYFDSPNFDDTSETTPELKYRLIVALLGSPWRSAISSLRNVYIITFILAILIILNIRKNIKKNIILPINDVNQSMSEGWNNIFTYYDNKLKYAEINELFKYYDDIKAQASRNRDTITRLELAIKYAQQAEENRRQITSNIAHELKTPLAVIHGYAQGLKERIAEGKRDKYLNIIIDESEKMDAMILEMLDLSRLEAGKVKLSREYFSISELASSIFEKLEHAYEEKNLNINFKLDEDCIINADPARIEQVITNFATNAIKYTEPGGSISVRTLKNRNSVTFSIENESPPLPHEVLSKVWDTFYRRDESRTDPGTGLGLAISKNIITLHRGKCYAKNTKIGVEFGFILEE